MAEFTDKPWNGAASKYESTEAYCSACLIDENPAGSDKKQSLCHLPVREPGGAVNKNALRNAAARINQVQASAESKAKAKGRLRGMMKAAGIETSLAEEELPPEEEAFQELADLLEEATTLAEANAFSVGDKVAWSKGGKDYAGTIKRIIGAVAMIELDGATGPLKHRFVGLSNLSKPAKNLDEKEVEAKLASLSNEELGRWEQLLEEKEGEGQYVYQLPYEESPLELASEGLWRKVIMHADRMVHHSMGEDGLLDHSREALAKIVENFKAKAFDQVPLLTHHPEDPAKEVFAYLGQVKDLALEGDELAAYLELTPKGEELVKENPDLPTSPGYVPSYERKNDKRFFGPTLQHLATVFKPHLHGLGGWEPVHLSAETEVVDLTGEQFGPMTRKESDPVTDAPTPTQHTEEVKEEMQEEPQTIEMSEEMRKVIELAEQRAQKAEERAKRAEENSLNTASQLAEQRVDARLQTEFAEVVPSFRSEIRDIILSEASSTTFERIDLAEDSTPVKREETLSDKLWGVLQMVKESGEPGKSLVVEMGERGREDVVAEPETESAQEARIARLAEEKFSDDKDPAQARRRAAAELMQRGEVNI